MAVRLLRAPLNGKIVLSIGLMAGPLAILFFGAHDIVLNLLGPALARFRAARAANRSSGSA